MPPARPRRFPALQNRGRFGGTILCLLVGGAAHHSGSVCASHPPAPVVKVINNCERNYVIRRVKRATNFLQLKYAALIMHVIMRARVYNFDHCSGGILGSSKIFFCRDDILEKFYSYISL